MLYMIDELIYLNKIENSNLDFKNEKDNPNHKKRTKKHKRLFQSYLEKEMGIRIDDRKEYNGL